MKKYNEILECVPLFRGISEEERQQMLDCLRAQQQRFATGAVILLAGDPADRVGVLLEGRAQVIREEFSGSRTILTGLNPGNLFAEAFACASGEHKTLPVTVLAVAESVVLWMDYRKILRACPAGCLPPPVGGKYACGGRGQKFDAQPPDRASLEAQHAGKAALLSLGAGRPARQRGIFHSL